MTWGTRTKTIAFISLAAVVALLVFGGSCGYHVYRDVQIRLTMQQFGLALKMYTNVSGGERFPPATDSGATLVPDLEAMFTLMPELGRDMNWALTPWLHSRDEIQAIRDAVQRDPPDWDAAHETLSRLWVYPGVRLETTEAMEYFAKNRAMLAPDSNGFIGPPELGIRPLRDEIIRMPIRDINDPTVELIRYDSAPILYQNPAPPGRRPFSEIYMLTFGDRTAVVDAQQEPERFRALKELALP